MLIMLIDDQLLSPSTICQSCLMAGQNGQPRWEQGRLRCGKAVRKITAGQPEQYECHMGFRIANVE